MNLIGSPFADSILIGYRGINITSDWRIFSLQNKSSIKVYKQSKVIKRRHKANQA